MNQNVRNLFQSFYPSLDEFTDMQISYTLVLLVFYLQAYIKDQSCLTQQDAETVLDLYQKLSQAKCLYDVYEHQRDLDKVRELDKDIRLDSIQALSKSQVFYSDWKWYQGDVYNFGILKDDVRERVFQSITDKCQQNILTEINSWKNNRMLSVATPTRDIIRPVIENKMPQDNRSFVPYMMVVQDNQEVFFYVLCPLCIGNQNKNAVYDKLCEISSNAISEIAKTYGLIN